jgi:hypothetical protein
MEWDATVCDITQNGHSPFKSSECLFQEFFHLNLPDQC